jgi:O-antigen ligase
MEIFEKIKTLKFTDFFNYYLGVISFVFCVFPKWTSPCLIGLLICTIVGYSKKKIVFHMSKPAILMVLLYVAYLIGTLFTHHSDIAAKYLEYKLSFIVFPLLLSFRFKEKMSFRDSVIGLVLGVIVSSVMGLFHSYSIYQSMGDFNNSFGSVRFSYIHHPSYFAVFLTIAMVASWYGFTQRWSGFRLAAVVLFSLFALVMQFFCFSLAGMLFLFLLGMILYVKLSFKYFNKLFFALAMLLIPIIPVALYKSNIHVQIEVDSTFSVIKKFTSNPENFIKNKTVEESGSEIRVIMWIVAYQEFKENMWGVGTGNVDDHLSARLIRYDKREIAKFEYNPHNQFLQTALEIGVLGLFIFLALIASSFYFAMKNNNWIMMILIFSLFFNSIFESMLQRQSGIVFYCFWICLLMVYSNSKNNIPIRDLS